MNTEKIIKILKIGSHRFDGTQVEIALYAKSDRRSGYRWYVGYGADYRPASKYDLDHITDIKNHDSEEYDYTGTMVHMYRI